MGLEAIWIYCFSYIGLFICLFFLLTFFENKDRIKDPSPIRLPVVSILIPAYNEEHTIEKTIYSVLRLNYPKDKLDIIVIDDGSTDRTYNISKKFEPQIRLLRKPNGGKASALNYALAHAKGELVATLDADSFVHPDALKKMVGYFEDPNVMAVTPALKVWKPKKFLERVQQAEYLLGVFLRKVFSSLNAINVTPGPFTVYRKIFFEEYGNYDEKNITEDMEIALRIQSLHYKIENAINADVFTIAPSKFWTLFRQRVRWYLGLIENTIRYKYIFGSPKYGDLGLVIYPSAFLSVFVVIMAISISISNLLIRFIKEIQYSSLITFNLLKYKLNYWLSNLLVSLTTPAAIIAFILIGLGLFQFYLVRKYSKDRFSAALGYVFFFFVYGFLFAFWWLGAIFYKIFGRKVYFGGLEWKNSLLNKILNRAE